MTLSRKDVTSAIITGFTAGFIAWRIMLFLEIAPIAGIPWTALVILVPVAWISGVQLGYILGRWFNFFNQFGKFVATGFTNAIIDFGVLNLLVAYSEITEGFTLTLFKAVAFLIAATHSFFWNKNWVFKATGGIQASQIGKFFTINLLSLVINTLVFAFVVSIGQAATGLEAARWVNVAAVAGSAAALIFNFVGFRLIVFKR